MPHITHRLVVPTRGRGFYEVTDPILAWVRAQKLSAGLLTVFIQHTSASLTIQENADPSVLQDLGAFLERIAPDDRRLYYHTTEGADDMPAHIRTALTQTHLSIPIHEGRLALGTWQGIYLCEHRKAPHQRSLVLHLAGE